MKSRTEILVPLAAIQAVPIAVIAWYRLQRYAWYRYSAIVRVVSVIKYRLKLKKHENVRWDEIMRIASTQVVVTAKVETVDGQVISIRQSTEAESKLSAIYDLLYINPKPLGKRKSMLHPNQTSKNPDIGNQGVT